MSASKKQNSGLALCLLLLAAMGLVFPGKARPADQPNIVLIMADDLGIEGLGCYGGSDYETPHLDQLAGGGLRFTHAYAQPLCTPTRLQVMTGKYNHRNWRSFGVLPQGERTIGHLLSELGYKTCLAGKWQLTSYDPPGFPGAEERRGAGTHPSQAGFDEYSLFHAEHTEDKGSRYANPTYLRNGVLHKAVAGAYGEDEAVDFVLDFLKRYRDQPTFVYYPLALPHWPMNPTPHSDSWADPARRLDVGEQYFKDMVQYLDFAVGRLVRGIDQLGIRERTLVLFYSDNGTDRRIVSHWRGQEVPGGKGEVTQNGIRVPLIANWPGTVEPGVCHDLIDSTDFLPTLVELAGGQVPRGRSADGVSFAPQLRGEASSPREWAFFWYDPRPGWDKERFRRHVFALDHQYKLFSDGRMYRIEGEGFAEQPVDPGELSTGAVAARAKLSAVIREVMQPPLSAVARREVDAFGRPAEGSSDAQADDWGTEFRPVEVARVATYTEGVVVDHDGNLYLSHADQISKVAADGRVSMWGSTPSPNGHKVLADGTHLVCDRQGAVYLLSAQGQRLRIVASPPHGANDICLDTPHGGFYFTSPYASQTEPKGTVCYADSLGQLRVVAEQLGFPNGIVLRPGGKTLLVGESLYNRILEFPVSAPGRVGRPRVFAELPPKGPSQPAAKPDGMALDETGNLYVAHYGMGRVQVLDPQGKLIASLPGAGIFTSNVAFAGTQMNQLYVTGSTGPTEQTTGMLVRLDLPWVKGLRILPERE